MLRNKILIVLTNLLFVVIANAQEVPKNIIIMEEEPNAVGDLEDLDSNKQEETNILFNEDDAMSTDEPNAETVDIIVDDIPKEFNEWYGVLSSENGGLGWLMWGNTNHEFALRLIRRTNFSTKSPTLFELTSKLLLSRAKEPKIQNNMDQLNGIEQAQDPLIYLKEKVRVLSLIGDTDNVQRLVESIPLEFKDKNFSNTILKFRSTEIDIPFICKQALQKNFNSSNIKKRETLIACNIALNKLDQAQLAIDLLDNDTRGKSEFIEVFRDFIDEPATAEQSLHNENLNNLNAKIMSLINYEIAKKVFSNDRLALDKIIYDMKLYTLDKQVEALERLVNRGIYDAIKLENAYFSLYESIKDDQKLNSITEIKDKNSVLVRANLFYLTNNSISNIERAKYLNLLWQKSKNPNIEGAVYKVTNNILNSLIPSNELSWFIYPATETLLHSGDIATAKNWLFFMSNDIKSRASLDINFCRLLILLHIKDINLRNNRDEIPDVNFLLQILNNSLEINKKDVFRLLITLKALDYDINTDLWNEFYMNEIHKGSKKQSFIIENNYFHLDEAVRERNLAEAILISINLLNSVNEKNPNFYKIYKGINALNRLGERKYARNYSFELNFGIVK